MFSFTPSDLALAACGCGLIAFLIIRPALGITAALIVTLIRFAIPTVYFLDPTFESHGWMLLDDITYFRHGVGLYDEGMHILTMPFLAEGREYLGSLTGSAHYLYSWWVGVGMLLLGPFYFSPVFVNVALSFLSARMIWRLSQLMGFSPAQARATLLLSLLHWDVIAWSSFVNLKDNLVLTLTTWLIVSIWQLFSVQGRRRLLYGAQVAICCALFFNLRFYVPLLLTAAVFIWHLLRGRSRLKFLIAAAILILMKFMLSQMLPLVQDTTGNTENIFINIARAILSPVPWNIVPEYSFLVLPASLHLLALPFAVVGAITLYRRSSVGALLVIYYGLLLLLMAYQPEYFGPRHRFQGVAALILMQFQGCLRIFKPSSYTVAASP